MAARFYKKSNMAPTQKHLGSFVLHTGHMHTLMRGCKGARRAPLHSALYHGKGNEEKKEGVEGKEGKRRKKEEGAEELLNMTRL